MAATTAAASSATSSNTLPSTMRAWHFTTTTAPFHSNLTLNSDAPLPLTSTSKLPKDSVLVRITYAALNPADTKVPAMPVAGRLMIGRPSSPCMDFAGIVVASNVFNRDLKEGQRVYGKLDVPMKFGTLAEYSVVPSTGCALLPEGVDEAQAGGIGVAGLTAIQSIQPYISEGKGDWVLINGGSGGTGTYGIQFAKALGCQVVTSCSEKNVELVKELGADRVIDYTKEDLVETLTKMATKENIKMALVVDNVGVDSKLFWKCQDFMLPNARFVQVGGEMSGQAAKELGFKLLWPGWLGGGKRKFEIFRVKMSLADLDHIAAWMKEGKVKTVIDSVFDMEFGKEAFEKLETGRVKGKILVKVR